MVRSSAAAAAKFLILNSLVALLFERLKDKRFGIPLSRGQSSLPRAKGWSYPPAMMRVPILAVSAALALFPAVANAKAPQWRSDKQDPAAVFTYLGFHLGESLDEVKLAHGPFPYAKRLAPNAVLYADTDGFGYPLVTELYFVDDKLRAIKATFDNQMIPPDEVEVDLETSYGPPQGREIADWVDRFGHHVKSIRLTWKTPVGLLQFDNKFQRLNQGAIQVNPDLIDGLTNKNGL